MSNRYTSVVDSEQYDVVPDEEIISVDAHLGVPIAHELYNHPEADPEKLAIVADELRSVGRIHLGARMEIESQHLNRSASYIPRFTAYELTDIAISLSIAKTKAGYNGNFDALDAILQFGRLITESADKLMAESFQYKEIPDLKPVDGPKDHIDPFGVIRSTQNIVFVDSHGEQILRDEFIESDDVQEISADY